LEYFRLCDCRDAISTARGRRVRVARSNHQLWIIALGGAACFSLFAISFLTFPLEAKDTEPYTQDLPVFDLDDLQFEFAGDWNIGMVCKVITSEDPPRFERAERFKALKCDEYSLLLRHMKGLDSFGRFVCWHLDPCFVEEKCKEIGEGSEDG
jgi:hypothetical protein